MTAGTPAVPPTTGVSGRAKEEGLELREAAYLIGLERVVEAAKTRGYVTT